MISVLVLASTVGARGDESWSLAPSAAVLRLATGQAAPSPEELLDAALLFSGADTARTEAARVRGREAIAAARNLALSVADEYERGSLVLELVHSRLSRYELLESRLDRTLLEGRYNCVGSSTLYAILASAAGLSLRGVILEDHAYCYLLIDGRRVDVETTAAGGYGGATAGSGPETESSIRGVVALALRNRATQLERAGQWFGALSLAVDAYAYAHDDATMAILSGRISNCVAALLRASRWSEAVGLSEAAIATYGPSPVFDRLEDTARIAAMTDALRTASPGGALAISEAAMSDASADAEWLERAFAYAYAALAEERRKAGDQLGAWNIAAEGASRFPGSEPLRSLERVAKGNWVKSVHNRFAELYNASRFEEALDAVRPAMELAPGEGLLKADADAAAKALGAATIP